jgi:hypothetical protein
MFKNNSYISSKKYNIKTIFAIQYLVLVINNILFNVTLHMGKDFHLENCTLKPFKALLNALHPALCQWCRIQRSRTNLESSNHVKIINKYEGLHVRTRFFHISVLFSYENLSTVLL